MSKPITKIFEFSEGVDGNGVPLPHDASVSEKSVGQEVCDNYVWLLNPVVAGLTSGDGTYTIEVSHEDVDASYIPYSAAATDAILGQAFDDDHFSPLWIRINYDKGTETTGTVLFPLVLKRP